ncbi:hypothetical protein DFP73DRAFT_378954 [Morchella snyderi]|nr:hypothetical protein DFP73DRAFT_378954 [Morchella snyderi]
MKAFLLSLKHPDYYGEKLKLKTPQSGTCEWILTHPQYLAWCSDQNTSVLYSMGKPGSGKTVLSRKLCRIPAQAPKIRFFTIEIILTLLRPILLQLYFTSSHPRHLPCSPILPKRQTAINPAQRSFYGHWNHFGICLLPWLQPLT